MPTRSRPPRASLRPFLGRVWASDGAPPAPSGPVAAAIERVLPTGSAHLVVRTSPAPLTLFADAAGGDPRVVGHAVVGGPRSSFYLRSIAEPSCAVGAVILPGAAPLLLGLPAGELAERHTALEDLWGRAAHRLRERLAGTPGLEARMALLEDVLAARLAGVAGVHPLVADAVRRLERGARVGAVVERSGLSHRALIGLFRGAVGLAPKAFARVVRAQRALALLDEPGGIAGAAARAGYADQAHFTRELAAIAGLAPRAYLAACPERSNHVPVPAGVGQRARR